MTLKSSPVVGNPVHCYFDLAQWLSDVALRSCSLAARGLWIDMNCIMHKGEPYGHLTLSQQGKKPVRPILPATLARMVGSSEKEVVALLAELEAAGVFSRAARDIIYSRQMVRQIAWEKDPVYDAWFNPVPKGAENRRRHPLNPTKQFDGRLRRRRRATSRESLKLPPGKGVARLLRRRFSSQINAGWGNLAAKFFNDYQRRVRRPYTPDLFVEGRRTHTSAPTCYPTVRWTWRCRAHRRDVASLKSGKRLLIPIRCWSTIKPKALVRE